MVSKKKKKKIVFIEIESDFSTKIGNSNVFSGHITKNRPQKHQKRAILHTSQANGEASPPPATLLRAICIWLQVNKEYARTLQIFPHIETRPQRLLWARPGHNNL